MVKERYQSLERILDSISLYLDVEPRYLLDRIQGLPKHQELEDLQARVDCLLKENGELKTKVEEGQALQKEMDKLRNRIAAVEEEAKIARAEQDKAKTVAQKIHGYLGFPGDVLNKVRLYDHGLKQPTTDSGVKMMRCMVDYGLKLEKTLKELHALLHPTGAQPEPVGTPSAKPSIAPAPTPSPEFVTPPVTQLDPLLQEPILDINTEDLASLKSWVEAGPENLTTPTTGTGTNIPGNLSTPGTISQKQQQRQEERTKRRAEDSVSKSGSSEEEEEDEPISLDSDEEEYQGSETPSQSNPGDESEMPPFKINRPTTRSTPKKPATRPKCKAARKQETGSRSKTKKRRRD